ncbi:hypothetical protein HYR99_23025 [Candidatus Poribacteria bacterium]|nr:hypothetical protein [Candidatus Poribacteria bacterium]
MTTVAISDELAHQAKLVAARTGYPTPESLIEEAIQQKLIQLQVEPFATLKGKLRAIPRIEAEESQRFTQRIRDKIQEKGISEEAILADFERFRQSLLKEVLE